MLFVSVIIPTYNRGYCILRSLESVIYQDYKPIEIIVIDDGSTDNTSAILSPYIKTGKIIYLKQEKSGAQTARIKGIKESKGNYITFLDSDDIMTANSISERINFIIKNHIGDCLVYGNLLSDGIVCHIKKLSGHVYTYLLKELSLCPYSTIMVSKNCFNEGNLPDSLFPACQDDDLVLTIGKKYPIYHCNKVVAEMISSPNSITQNKETIKLGCKMLIDKYSQDIINYHGYFRYFLWKLRYLRIYIQVKISSYQKENGFFPIAKRKFLALFLRIINKYLSLYFDYIYF